MAFIEDDFMRCPVCGSKNFEERNVVTIKRNYAKVIKVNENKKIPDRFIDSEKIFYVCTECGSNLL